MATERHDNIDVPRARGSAGLAITSPCTLVDVNETFACPEAVKPCRLANCCAKKEPGESRALRVLPNQKGQLTSKLCSVTGSVVVSKLTVPFAPDAAVPVTAR